MCKHITVLLRNVPGQVSAVASRLRDEHLNILAFHVALTGSGSGYVQLICDYHLRALAALSARFPNYVYESEVLVIKTRHVPGSLAETLLALYQAKVNVENAYQTLDKDRQAIIVFEVSPPHIVTAKIALEALPDTKLVLDTSELRIPI